MTVKRDDLPCGCVWKRHPDFGDVLQQCEAHRLGAPYDGGKDSDVTSLVGLLRDAGFDATLLHDPEVPHAE